MRKKVCWTAFAAGLAILWGCASDIVLEEEAPLKGVYKGRYIVTTLGQDVERIQTIDWVFDDVSFHMDVDATDPFWNRDFCLYNVDGPYVLENKVRLEVTSAAPPFIENWDCVSRDETVEPNGSFDKKTSGDTLILTYQDTENNYLKEIKLVLLTQ